MVTENNTLLIILGNQLFDYKYYKNLSENVFMCEDFELCTHYKYHKHKIIHFLASMREFSDYLKSKDKNMFYFKLEDRPQYLERLEEVIKGNNIEKIQIYEIEDHFFEEKLAKFFKKLNIQVEYLETPFFLCSRDDFREYLEGVKKPFMNTFYINQRRKLNIMTNGDAPEGGKWSFDDQNRKKIPKNFEVESFIPKALDNENIKEVKALVEKYFHDHPGEVYNYWIPTNRKDSINWFKHYLNSRFSHFGDFQDAIDTRAPFLYHSVISPLMNIGFLLPGEVVKEVLKFKTQSNINSIEGFVRQVIGWREFVRGIYQNFDPIQQNENFFDHEKKLTDHWYQGNTGIAPLDDAILKAQEWGYCHHIERLMVIGNLMLLLEIHPKEVFKWFMEMFVDSSDWVMGPNVFGMSQFSDGGLFATKPYICGSNYLLKMSHYKKTDWCEGVDGLYWMFIEKNSEFFKSNPRMSMMVRNLEKMDGLRKKTIYKAANELRKKLTK